MKIGNIQKMARGMSINTFQKDGQKKEETPIVKKPDNILMVGSQSAKSNRRDLVFEIEESIHDLLSTDRLSSLNEQILNMLMIMSHDIRGSLVSIAAALKLLNRGVHGKMDESVQNAINDLYVRIFRLIGTAEDCMGKVSVVNDDLEIERKMLDLRMDVIDPVLDELTGEIKKHTIVIDNRLNAIPANRIPIKASKFWLKSVFRNLLQNAIKYGGKGCSISFGYEDHSSYYRFNVYNSGNHIPEAYRKKLFTKFGQIKDGGNGNANGVGLGLYLIREIIQKHGGEIWYEAKEDGSNFVFTLPKD